MKPFLSSAILGAALLGAWDLITYYLGGGYVFLASAALGRLFGVEGGTWFAWWFGGVLSIGLLITPLARDGLTRGLAQIPAIDDLATLQGRRWMRGCLHFMAVVLPALVLFGVLGDLRFEDVTTLPQNALIVTGWLGVALAQVLEAWPAPAPLLSATLPESLPPGRTRPGPGHVVLRVPWGRGARDVQQVDSGRAIFKRIDEDCDLVAYRAGCHTTWLSLLPIRFGPLELHSSCCCVTVAPRKQSLAGLDLPLFLGLGAYCEARAGTEAPDLLKQRCLGSAQGAGFRDAAWLLTLGRALDGVGAAQHQPLRKALASATRHHAEFEISQLRDQSCFFSLDGTCGLAALVIRVEDVRVVRDESPEPSSTPVWQIDLKQALALNLLDGAEHERLRSLALGEDDARLLQWVRDEVRAYELRRHGHSSLEGAFADGAGRAPISGGSEPGAAPPAPPPRPFWPSPASGDRTSR